MFTPSPNLRTSDANDNLWRSVPSCSCFMFLYCQIILLHLFYCEYIQNQGGHFCVWSLWVIRGGLFLFITLNLFVTSSVCFITFFIFKLNYLPYIEKKSYACLNISILDLIYIFGILSSISLKRPHKNRVLHILYLCYRIMFMFAIGISYRIKQNLCSESYYVNVFYNNVVNFGLPP